MRGCFLAQSLRGYALVESRDPLLLLPRRRLFYHRFAAALLVASSLVLTSLCLGILGYHFIAGFAWVDALLNSSMILAGMGPVGELRSTAAKLFASFYALFSGLVLVTATGIILSPMFHHVLHRFHLEQKGDR